MYCFKFDLPQSNTESLTKDFPLFNILLTRTKNSLKLCGKPYPFLFHVKYSVYFTPLSVNSKLCSASGTRYCGCTPGPQVAVPTPACSASR